MRNFSYKDINEMHHLYRINLINSCSGYKSANLIGTKSKSGISNVAVFSSITHIGSDPSMLGFFLRPTTQIRNTYTNIKETRKFTINHIHEDILHDAHHTSAKYADSISDWTAIQFLRSKPDWIIKGLKYDLGKKKDGHLLPSFKKNLK